MDSTHKDESKDVNKGTVLTALITAGFVIQNHDDLLLTKKGRKLRELESLDAFDIWYVKDKKQKEVREILGDKLLANNVYITKYQKVLLWVVPAVSSLISIISLIVAMASYSKSANKPKEKKQEIQQSVATPPTQKIYKPLGTSLKTDTLKK